MQVPDLGATAHSTAVHTFSFDLEPHGPTGNGAKFPLRNTSFFNGSVRPLIPLFPVVLSHSGSRMVAGGNCWCSEELTPHLFYLVGTGYPLTALPHGDSGHGDTDSSSDFRLRPLMFLSPLFEVPDVEICPTLCHCVSSIIFRVCYQPALKATSLYVKRLPHLDLNESQHGYSSRNCNGVKSSVNSMAYNPLLHRCYRGELWLE